MMHSARSGLPGTNSHAPAPRQRSTVPPRDFTSEAKRRFIHGTAYARLGVYTVRSDSHDAEVRRGLWHSSNVRAALYDSLRHIQKQADKLICPRVIKRLFGKIDALCAKMQARIRNAVLGVECALKARKRAR